MKKLKMKYMAMAVMVLGIATVSFFACRFTKENKDSNIYGVDLSHHNCVEDWDQVTASFVYLKATEGATHQDETFKRFAHNAQKRGILVGAYHFMTTSSSSEEQFQNFHQATAGIKMDLIPVIDIERQTKGYKVSGNELRKRVRVFVNLCKKHYGKNPIIYCSQPFYTKNFLGHFNDCQYWCGDVNAPVVLSHAIHQKTIKKVAGLKEKVDYNILNCKLKEIQL